MINYIAEHLFCSACFGLRFGPSHLFRKIVCGVDCDRS